MAFVKSIPDTVWGRRAEENLPFKIHINKYFRVRQRVLISAENAETADDSGIRVIDFDIFVLNAVVVVDFFYSGIDGRKLLALNQDNGIAFGIVKDDVRKIQVLSMSVFFGESNQLIRLRSEISPFTPGMILVNTVHSMVHALHMKKN